LSHTALNVWKSCGDRRPDFMGNQIQVDY
jgi:hypothetical protein